MLPSIKPIDSAERMIAAVRTFGIVPFFRNSIPGWSIEEHTAPGYWFGKEEDGGGLGPWDWKIDTIREGDIAYGKFLNGKAAFATVEWYRHLMNWRRSLPQYRLALGETVDVKIPEIQLNKLLSPTLLQAIRDNGSLESAEMRKILKEKTDPADLKTISGCIGKYLYPEIKKQAIDHLLQYLEMGTWTIIGDFTRVYKGPDLTYSGWQRSSVTTPDALFAEDQKETSQPFWAHFIDDTPSISIKVNETPEESRKILINHLTELFPEHTNTINKYI